MVSDVGTCINLINSHTHHHTTCIVTYLLWHSMPQSGKVSVTYTLYKEQCRAETGVLDLNLKSLVPSPTPCKIVSIIKDILPKCLIHCTLLSSPFSNSLLSLSLILSSTKSEFW